MLGWEIMVTRQDSQSPKAALGDGTLLVAWQTGIGGDKWLDELAANGRASYLGGDGYPARWLIPVEELRSVLAKGIPKPSNSLVIGEDYVMPPGWTQLKVLERTLIDSLDPKEMLVVEAWDLS